MDSIDLSILKCLKKNSRQTASMISQTINLSVSAVIERIRKMEARGMIQQYTVVLDEKQLGNDLAVFMSVRLEHPGFGEDFAREASSHPNITECYHIAGDVDYLLKIVTDSSSSLELIHQDINKMPGVSWTKTLYVLSTIKNDVSVLPDQI